MTTKSPVEQAAEELPKSDREVMEALTRGAVVGTKKGVLYCLDQNGMLRRWSVDTEKAIRSDVFPHFKDVVAVEEKTNN